MVRAIRRSVLGGVGIVVASAVVRAQNAAARPRASVIEGVVTDTSLAPLATASIGLAGTNIRVSTGENGRFRIVSVPAGDYMLVVRRIGFAATTARIVVTENDTLRLSLALRPAIATLDTVSVASRSTSWRLAEFNERRKVGPGQFLTQDEIDKRNAVRTSDLFRMFLGIEVGETGATSARGAPRFLGSSGCQIPVVVDGVTRVTNFYWLPPPKEIAAVEFYAGPSEIPLQYKSTSSGWCGLILIWTRDGS